MRITGGYTLPMEPDFSLYVGQGRTGVDVDPGLYGQYMPHKPVVGLFTACWIVLWERHMNNRDTGLRHDLGSS